MRLKGKRAVITGAGSGIGREAACLFAREGARVIVVDIDDKGGQETVRLVNEAGGEANFVRADVSREQDLREAVEQALARYGGLDIMFNNAGIPQRPTPIEDLPDEVWDRIMAINVKGVYLGSKVAAPILKRQGRGVILNTASVMGLRVRPQFSAYAASKAAVIAFTKALALELAPHGVRVNCLCPVATDTPMLPGFMAGDEESGRKAFIASIPLGRLCTPYDVASAALFLASDEASFLTGVALEVDGGRGI